MKVGLSVFPQKKYFQQRINFGYKKRYHCWLQPGAQEHISAHKLPARRAFPVRAAVCNDARTALGPCPQNGDMFFWCRVLQRAPDARNCLNAHIICARIPRARTHQCKQTPRAARIPRARRRLQRRATRARTVSPKRVHVVVPRFAAGP